VRQYGGEQRPVAGSAQRMGKHLMPPQFGTKHAAADVSGEKHSARLDDHRSGACVRLQMLPPAHGAPPHTPEGSGPESHRFLVVTGTGRQHTMSGP
jgi:hypothetical protein